MRLNKKEAIAINSGLIIFFIATYINGEATWLDYLRGAMWSCKMDFLLMFIDYLDNEFNLNSKQ